MAETYYGSGFIRFLSDLKASGKWTPKNNKVHIVQEQIGYTQVISKATQEAIAASGGEWEVGAITDIQFPVQDWAPVMRALKETNAGAIMIDHVALGANKWPMRAFAIATRAAWLAPPSNRAAWVSI